MVEINGLVELLMEEPEATATNAEFAEWLKEQDELQNKEREWKDRLYLRDERKTNQGDSDRAENSEKGSRAGS